MKKLLVIPAIILALFVAGCAQKASVLGPDEAKAKIVDFINNNLMQPGNEVSIKEITQEGDLYKVVVNTAQGQEIDSYMTRDGKKFFPQVMDIAEIEQQAQADASGDNQQAAAAPAVSAPKAEKASVELFVMSYCPYGTQIEKGLLPVLSTLGDKVDFELKFCDYAMHGEKELTENMTQYCIEKNEPQKLTAYLQCFLDAGDSASCLKSVGVNTSKLNSCVAETDSTYKITDNFKNNVDYRGSYPGFAVYKNDNDKYGVSGSPTLVINGQTISANRDSESLLSTICSGYDNPPEECSTVLSSDAPSPGFGYSTTNSGDSAAANCGS